MSFIGNAPAAIPTSFQAVQADSFNGTGSAVNFTLSRQITNLYDIEVLVDNVQQSPYDGSYSVSGTTLTFSSAPSSGTNNIYVIYRDHPITSIAPVGNLNVDGDVSVSGTTKTNAIVDYSGGTTATINGYTPTASNMAGKNRIINGAMMIDQRNAGAAVTASFVYSVDRFYQVNNVTSSTFSVQQDSSAPQGFTNSLKVTITAAASPTGGEQVNLRQYIEGFNTADLNWGTANAKTVTLSFWVKSSVTGTFGGAVSNNAFDRVYAYEYAINSANTWEYKTVTISGDTTGTWETGNAAGVRVYFGLGAATYKKTAGIWDSTFAIQSTGSVDLCATNGATFYITGVQLEVGSSATEFEHRLYGQELALCQRYFETISSIYHNGYQAAGQPLSQILGYRVTKRATPTITVTTTPTYAVNSSGFSVFQTDTMQTAVYVTTGSLGQTVYTNGAVSISAEL